MLRTANSPMPFKPRQELHLLSGARFAIALSLVVALALLAGCGDDNGATSAEPADNAGGGAAAEQAGEEAGGDSATSRLSDEPIAKRAFVKQANRICEATVEAVIAQAGPALEDIWERPEADREAIEAELFETVMAPELRRQVEKIQALGTPSGDRAQIERMLAATLRVADEAETNPEVAARSNQATFARSSALAERYGLDSCPYG